MLDSRPPAFPATPSPQRCIISGERRQRSAPPQGRSDVITFPSLSSLAAVLCDENRELLRTLHKLQPRSLTELSGICGRKVPSLSRTLRLMEGYGLVELRRVGARVRPLALVTTFVVVLD
ncbi:transcriptional regulator [Stenotrophomonas indicatrix]